ncbi:MAG: alpha-amylase family glycosyl hydrolase [Planctomycetota bacterium]
MLTFPGLRSRMACLFFVVATMCTAWSAQAATHRFTFDASDHHPAPEAVYLAGSFNGWSATHQEMEAQPGGLWALEVDLPDGVHQYKFVLDGETWLPDPTADPALNQPDGHGGVNSGVLVGFDARKLPAPRDNFIDAEYVRHDPEQDRRVVADGELFTLAVRTQAGEAKSVWAVVFEPDGSERKVALPKVSSILGWDRYSAMVRVDRRDVAYAIELVDGDFTLRLGDPEPMRFEVVADFVTPDWAKDVVWYQIFPERFRNGDPSNDPGDYWYETLLPWTGDWWVTDTGAGEAPGQGNFYLGEGNVWNRRYGGDLQGVQEKLPYLRELGVTAIYFNPIFEGESMHKYDAADYRHIDDNFGVKSATPSNQIPTETDDPATWQWSASDKVFLDFLEEAHRQGFKVVIDGVFNHVGRAHPFFQDVLAKGPDSAYADWFEITDWGDPEHWRPMDDPMSVHGRPGGIQWIAWDDVNGHLPAFKKDPVLGLAPGPRQHVFDITRRWLAPDGDPSRGIDGWRLDVPQDIPMPFWRDWRKVVKETKPDAYITGEIWHFAQPWLEGDQFDAVMNYEFAKAAQDFFMDQEEAISPEAMGRRLEEVAYAYPLQVSLVMQNLFDSHDTDRVASMIVNPDLPYDGENRLQDTGPDYDPRKPNADEWAKLRLAAAFKMTYLGAPMIYYGTEAGMWSPDDPSNRMPMIWEDLGPYANPEVVFRRPLFEHYQKWIALRQAVPALRRGLYRTILAPAQGDVLVFERSLDNQRVYVAINRGDRAESVSFEVDDADAGASFVDLGASAELVRAGTVADARPEVRLAEGATRITADGRAVNVELSRYSISVLIRPAELP